MARKTLEQRIAFEGGKEFEAQLKALGETGERAFAQIRKATEAANSPNAKLSASVVRLKANVSALQAAGKRLGDSFRTIRRRGTELVSVLRTVTRRMTLLATAALGAAAAITAVARSGAAAADQAAKTAEGLGLSIEQYTGLKFAATQSGLKIEQFETALSSLNAKVAEAAKGQRGLNDQLGLQPERWAEAQRAMAVGGAALDAQAEGGNRAAQALRALGVEVSETGLQFVPVGQTIKQFASGLETAGAALRDPFDILLDLADAFAAFPDGVEEAGIAAALFGEGVARFMLPFLNQGSAGIRELLGEADRLGATFTTQQGKIGTALIDAQGRLGASLKALKDQIGLLFAPALTEAADRQTEALIRHRQAILDLTSGAVPKAVALVEDLVAALTGRDQDVREPFILEARDAIVAFARDVRAAFEGIIVPAFRGLLAIFDQLAVAVNAAFGTDFSGRTLLIAAVVAQLLGVFSGLGAAVLAVSALVIGVLPEAIAKVKELFEVLFAGAGEQAGGDVLAFGKPLSEFQLKVLEIKRTVLEFADAVKAAFEKIIVPAFKGLIAAADKVAGAINKVFGTELSGTALLIVAIVAQWLGLFRTIAAVFVIVVSVVSLIKTAILLIAGAAEFLILIGLWPALLVAALVLAAAAVVVFWDDIVAAGQAAIDFIATRWSDMVDGLVADFKSGVDFLARLFSRLMALAARAFRAAREALGLSGGGSASGAGVPVLTGGGQVRGPGTTTSDSIPAWLSDKEFVMQARAVRYYGTSFMRAVNHMRLPKFSLGGLVDGLARSLTLPLMPIPAYAAGGPVAAALPAAPSGESLFTLVLGGQSFQVRSDQETAEAIGRIALIEDRHSIGRGPRRSI
jgi:hypothetical protein